MRIPFPNHIPMKFVMPSTGLFMLLELIQGTDPIFALYVCGSLLITVLAFNRAGGLSYPSGGFIFFFSVLTFVIGLAAKAFYGEAAQTNLLAPLLTIKLYFVTVCGLFVAASVSRRFRYRGALLARLPSRQNYSAAIWGSLIFGSVVTILVLLPHEQGTLVSALGQVNRFLPFSIILGVTYQIERSRGKRFLSVPVVIAAVLLFSAGLLYFSKEVLFTPIFCILLAAAARRFEFKLYQLALLVCGVFYINYYLVPYSQLGRSLRVDNPSLTEAIPIALQGLAQLDRFHDDYAALQKDLLENQSDEAGFKSYYDQPVGLLGRLEFLTADDALINLTATEGPIGPAPIFLTLRNLAPRFVSSDKSTRSLGNIYAHEIGGVIAEDDLTTGISFSAVGEAFHLLGWLGPLVLTPVFLSVLFLISDSIGGSLDDSPWGLLYMVVFAHAAPEGGILSAIYSSTYVAFGVMFSSVVTGLVLPFVFALLFRRRPAA